MEALQKLLLSQASTERSFHYLARIWTKQRANLDEVMRHELMFIMVHTHTHAHTHTHTHTDEPPAARSGARAPDGAGDGRAAIPASARAPPHRHHEPGVGAAHQDARG